MLALSNGRKMFSGRLVSRVAIPVLREALEQQQQDAKLHFLLIESLQAACDYEAALQTAGETVRLFPNQPQGYSAKAQELLRMGKYQDAGPVFEWAW